MRRLRFVLGDQLTRGLSSLADLDPAQDVVLMVEVAAEARYVPHHRQKIAFVLSAMRNFAKSLKSEGINVDYVTLDDPENTHSFSGEIARAVVRHAPASVVVTEPGEWRVLQMIQDWDLICPVEIRPDDRFFCLGAEFAALAKAGKTSRLEFFYREMRRRTGLLMAGEGPEGGQWNFDPENRKSLPRGHQPPPRRRFEPDAITAEVLALVETRFDHHFGDLTPFGWAVTREGALQALDHFIAGCLPDFGDYQDAMKAGEDFLYHSLISPYLNIGLLTAREVCDRAEAAYRAGDAPINAVEGFIRQILGWREFVRGIYWTEMPGYARTNHLNAARDLPALYWTGDTQMHCMADCIAATRRHAYAHHIQRLMVTGNFALLAGVSPPQIEEWYLAVYADAYEWVELPNVHGMVMHADGGRMGSKPYAASGAYINRMSDYCKTCAYDPKVKLGPTACPFNYLYWNFLIENEAVLSRNLRMAMPYKTLARMPDGQRADIARSSQAFLDSLPVWTGESPPHE
ncbi:cryptochrome/photolyase family protein [Frigidibacter albus]|uniref:Cryptochrome/photolyase family protein n=1 Tax=Frigidibacter albus TaxID=1465486 RepID=A0A6L8VJ08_9RHOB|nr:cryptochrome/photolyase family protein [Frigidibacter albus]MZQ89170.1 cryptochrome/photolyase family protein [Frigidibacter albus]NBE30773.1 cryptochrome/photolyase family protein [Frigidibacter albus]GGH50988.1 deoxyribodipyrimidine photo-lyase [Frigidibacter albus]